MSARLVSPVLVGRQEELAALDAAYARASAGEPAVVFVGGEAGVGKTRLVEESTARAASAGTRVLAGSCLALGGDGVPFAPLVDALRVLVRTTSPAELDALVGGARRDLARLLPDLAGAEVDGAVSASGGANRLFELVLGVLTRVAAERPLVLVVEDLHWADRSTLDLVVFLVRALRSGGVALVVTYRSDELHRRHPLRPVLAELERLRTVQRVSLERFDRGEVAEQLSAILEQAPSGGLLDEIYRRSEGNAFFVEELAELAQAGKGELSPSLRDVLLARVERLSERTQRVLKVVAVGGRRVEHRLLEVVAGLDASELDEAVQEAVEHHVLVVDERGAGYEFRHALLRDAVYDDILPGLRVRLHAAWAETLERDGTGAPGSVLASETAHHFYRAHDMERALPAMIAAGRQAVAALAYADAARQFELALEIWPRVADAEERTGVDHLALLELASEATSLAGDDDRALLIADEALSEVDREREPIRTALLLERRARLLRQLARGDGVEELEAAVRLLPSDPPTFELALVLDSLANAAAVFSRWDELGDVAPRAVAVARAVGATQHEANALVSQGTGLAAAGETERAIETMRAGLRLAHESGNDLIVLRGYINLADTLEAVGRHEEAAEVAREGLGFARAGGFARTWGAFLIGNLAEPLLRLGRFEEAEQLVAEGVEVDPRGVHGVFLLQLRTELASAVGRYDEAAEHARRAAALLGDFAAAPDEHVVPMAAVQADVDRATNELARAAALVESGLERPGARQVPRYLWPLLSVGARIAADAAERARDRREAVDPVAARLAEAVREQADATAAASPAQRAHEALTTAELARAAGASTAAVWAEAVRAWRDAHEPHPLAYALLRLAEACVAEHDRATAEEAARESLAIAEQLGAQPIAADVRALAERARLQLGAAGPSTAETDECGRLGLTSREAEVLRLVAAGRSNSQIGSELFISAKTASVHVSNILAKLDVASRTEAAAVAHRLRLFDAGATP